MYSRSVLPILAIALLQSGLLCGAGFAATRTASFSVSVTVEAGCQVFPAAGAAAASGMNGRNGLVSVNCSLPVAYQIGVDSGPRTEFAGLGPLSSGLADRPGIEHVGDLDLLRSPHRPTEPIEDVESDQARHVFAGLPSGLDVAAECTADGEDAGAIRVTVVY